jgi:DNA-binding NtrC family response regulator
MTNLALMTNLQRSEYISLLNAIDNPAIIIDLNYQILMANQHYLQHFEIDNVQGKHCYEISHQSPLPCAENGEQCPLDYCASHKKSKRVVHIHQHDNQHEYCHIKMQPIIDDHGITIAFLEVLEQIPYASVKSSKDRLVGHSQAFIDLIELIDKVAKTDISVLLHGETGTGKELVAQAIHQASERNKHPFVIVECTGLNESLFESELFGHEKGAFTGANQSKKGLVELAENGTLFLDEIGDVPLNLQVKLLRLLETGSYRKVGGISVKKANFRLICASHKNLPQLVAEGNFREDLYYRISTFPIRLPSLAERQQDIPELAKHFLANSSFSYKTLSHDCLNKLQLIEFKGNIRELKNTVERLAVLADDDIIGTADLEKALASSPYIQQKNIATATEPSNTPEILKLQPLPSVEANYLRYVMLQYRDLSLDDIANQLAISKRTLYRKLKLYGISINNSKTSDLLAPDLLN